MKTNIHFRSQLAQLFLERRTFQTKIIEKLKTHILYSITFFIKSCRLWDNGEKYCWAGQATDDNMAHAHCVLDTWDQIHTHTHKLLKLIACPPQQWLHEPASMPRYTYIVSCYFSYNYHNKQGLFYWKTLTDWYLQMRHNVVSQEYQYKILAFLYYL
jgi:hypothetical protein